MLAKRRARYKPHNKIYRANAKALLSSIARSSQTRLVTRVRYAVLDDEDDVNGVRLAFMAVAWECVFAHAFRFTRKVFAPFV
jgi:hypothetical protein